MPVVLNLFLVATHILRTKDWRPFKFIKTIEIWPNCTFLDNFLYKKMKPKVWSYMATQPKKLATHLCVATQWLRTTGVYPYNNNIPTYRMSDNELFPVLQTLGDLTRNNARSWAETKLKITICLMPPLQQHQQLFLMMDSNLAKMVSSLSTNLSISVHTLSFRDSSSGMHSWM